MDNHCRKIFCGGETKGFNVSGKRRIRKWVMEEPVHIPYWRELQPYDRFYYSAKMKKELLNITDDEIKPYFNIDSVQINGVFYAAHKVYGLNFKQRKDIPTYHPDMKVFEVSDKNGKPLALFYSDFFRRPTKRGGAWMSAFAKQSRQRGQLPIIYNVCNNAKAPEGQPSLITWDEVCTMFHEFGHALHGMLSKCGYNTLSGTAVARDFVETLEVCKQL